MPRAYTVLTHFTRSAGKLPSQKLPELDVQAAIPLRFRLQL
jgi:hypothetical protein